MSRYVQINQFLENAKSTIVELHEIKATLLKKPGELLPYPKLASVLNDLRTCLDYVTGDIIDKILVPSGVQRPGQTHFPYGSTLAGFNNSVRQRGLNQLRTINPTLFSYIEGVQVHKSNNFIISRLCRNNNDVKHDSTEHTRTDKKALEIGGLIRFSEDSEDMTLSNVYVDGKNASGYIGKANDKSTITIDHNLVSFKTEDIEFYFKNNTTDEIFKHIESAHGVVKKMIDNCYTILPQT